MCGRILARTLSIILLLIAYTSVLLYIVFEEDRASGTITGLSFSTIVLLMIGLSALSTLRRKRIRG